MDFTISQTENITYGSPANNRAKYHTRRNPVIPQPDRSKIQDRTTYYLTRGSRRPPPQHPNGRLQHISLVDSTRTNTTSQHTRPHMTRIRASRAPCPSARPARFSESPVAEPRILISDPTVVKTTSETAPDSTDVNLTRTLRGAGCFRHQQLRLRRVHSQQRGARGLENAERQINGNSPFEIGNTAIPKRLDMS